MQVPVIGITGRVEERSPPGARIVSLGETYVRAVTVAGGAPVVLDPHGRAEALRPVFERLDGLLLSGGGDVSPSFYGESATDLLWHVDENRDRAELALARWALAQPLPLLAICRGIQVLNAASGGTLYQDVGTQVPDALMHPTLGSRPMATIAHTVAVSPGSRLAAIVGARELGVNSAHHQAVKQVGEGLVVTARAPDGVIEGLECPSHPFCIGVQWHPEAMVAEHPLQRRLFEALVAAACSTCP
jgi:putative glutamine amidotransferase